MKSLFKAIYERWVAVGNCGLTNLYDTQAPAEAVFPYGTFSMPSNTPDWTFSEKFENCLIQFSLFSKLSSSDEVCACFELLKTAFDFEDVELSIVGYRCISLERESAILFKVEKVWQYSATYRIYLQKSLGD